MKYFVRAVKYFVFLMIILALIIAVMVAAGFVEGDISQIFVHGYDSLWQIALIMAVFAAIYPRLGYSRQTASVRGSIEDLRSDIDNVMELHGYKLEKAEPGMLSYVKRSALSRVLKMWEDRVIFTTTPGGVQLEGITKDIVRLRSGLETKVSTPLED